MLGNLHYKKLISMALISPKFNFFVVFHTKGFILYVGVTGREERGRNGSR